MVLTMAIIIPSQYPNREKAKKNVANCDKIEKKYGFKKLLDLKFGNRS